MQPSFPGNIPVSKEMRETLVGKKIIKVSNILVSEAKTYVASIFFDQTEHLEGQKIIYADSNLLQMDNNWRVEFGYDGGGLRFCEKYIDPFTLFPKRNYKTGGYIAQFAFSDGSYMFIYLNSWCCRFRVYSPDEFSQIPDPYPISPADSQKFTWENFIRYFRSRDKDFIYYVCTTAKTGMDVNNGVALGIFWETYIHPKSKVFALDDSELRRLYDRYVAVANAYENGQYIYGGYTDIFGVRHVQESVISFGVQCLQHTCKRCGSHFEKTSGGGSNVYYCPVCQIKK